MAHDFKVIKTAVNLTIENGYNPNCRQSHFLQMLHPGLVFLWINIRHTCSSQGELATIIIDLKFIVSHQRNVVLFFVSADVEQISTRCKDYRYADERFSPN